MSATEELKEEHRVIERVLGIIETGAARADAGQALPVDFFIKMADFIRNFADRCHHGKEEDNLFPVMEKRGISAQAGPIGVMLMEHAQGRTYVQAMNEAGKRYASGDKTALKTALDNALGYAQLLRQHIEKEDNILYNIADQVLTADDQQNLIRKFEEVERERIGSGGHEKYLKLVENLERQLAVK